MQVTDQSSSSYSRTFTINHNLPLSHPTNIPGIFNFLIQHLSLSTYLTTSSLLTLQLLSSRFFHLITPLLYTNLIIDLKDPRNPATSISPFKFYPNPTPLLSIWKSIAFSYTIFIEFTGSHIYECGIFDNQLTLPKLECVRVTLPSGKYKSWCGKQSLDHIPIRKEDVRCGLLKRLKAEKIIAEFEKFGRLELWGRKDWFENDQLVVRIGKVGEDAVLDGKGRWPLLDEGTWAGKGERGGGQGGEGEGEAGGQGQGQGAGQGLGLGEGRGGSAVGENGVKVSDEEVGDQVRKIGGTTAHSPLMDPVSNHPNIIHPTNEWFKSLNLTPSLNRTNTVPNLTIIFLSPPNITISKPLISEDRRTNEQRVTHHLIALSNIISLGNFDKITLVNIGVLLFYKYGMKRDNNDLRKMQVEIKGILIRLIKIKSNDYNDAEVMKSAMNKVEFVLLDDYLKEEKGKVNQSIKLKAKSGEKSKRSLY